MLIDTHCHLNIMVKNTFDTPIDQYHIKQAVVIVDNARKNNVTAIINVGTSLIESKNCIALAQIIPNVFATIGIHPNDAQEQWRQEIKIFEQLLKNKEQNKIVGIGECGIDRHYAEYHAQRQHDVFKAQIELALMHDVGLVIHSRDAYDETLRILEEYKGDALRAVMHCFSYDQLFADQVITWGFKLGIGGTVTYPKNKELRDVVAAVSLDDILLETDAPYLPPQSMRGKKNSPSQIKEIAEYIAHLKEQPFEQVAERTTRNASELFRFSA